jgi:hypothetical protein
MDPFQCFLLAGHLLHRYYDIATRGVGRLILPRQRVILRRSDLGKLLFHMHNEHEVFSYLLFDMPSIKYY